MPSRPNHRRHIERAAVTRRARELADTGDRWFLSLAGGLVRVGGWARREADIAAESAVAAFSTTVKVAKKLTRARAEGPVRERAGVSTSVESRASAVRPGAPRGPVPLRDIDLMAAMPASAWEVATRERWATGRDDATPIDDAPSPAGVTPLLQALGRTVADHTRAGYSTLHGDERFWTLIRLLHQLASPAEEPREVAQSSAENDDPGREP